jgi:hypothetical protein
MKILIENYSSPLTTEPIYLNVCLNKTQGSIQSVLWNSYEISAFDIIDRVNPDVIIINSTSRVVLDVIKYLKQSPKKIDIILNTTQIGNENIEKLEEYLANNNVKPICFIDSSYHNKTSKTKINSLYPAADLFMEQSTNFYDIEAAIITDSADNLDLIKQQASNHQTYHKFIISNEQTDGFDKNLSLFNFNSISKNYSKVIIAGEIDFVFSQVFFDSIVRSNKVLVKTKDTEKYTKVLADLFNQEDAEDLSSLLKNQVMKKHTCYNRAIRLLRMLKCENAAMILESAKESL